MAILPTQKFHVIITIKLPGKQEAYHAKTIRGFDLSEMVAKQMVIGQLFVKETKTESYFVFVKPTNNSHLGITAELVEGDWKITNIRKGNTL